MKLEKLFHKLESFFEMDKSEQDEHQKKKEKLSMLLAKKIESKKQKIKDTDNKTKKEKIKEELNILNQLSKKYQM